MWSPRAHSWSMYGPVPFGFSTIEPSATALSRYLVSLIANELNAIFERNATSGAQRSKRTVFASTAVSFLNVPVYGATPHGASPLVGYEVAVNGSLLPAEAGALAAPELALGLGDAAPLQAVKTIAAIASNANSDHLGDRDMLSSSSSNGPPGRTAGAPPVRYLGASFRN